MRSCMALVLVSFLAANGAWGEKDMYTIAKPQTVRVGGFGGILHGGDTLENSPVLGADLVYQVTPRFSLEFVAAFSRDDLPEQSFEDGGVAFVTDAELNLQVFSLLARVQQPLTSRLSVYGAGGLGYHRYDIKGERAVVDPATVPAGFTAGLGPLEVNVDNEFGLHLAAGLLVTLSDFFEFFLEYRHSLVDRELEYVGGVVAQKEVEVAVPGGEPGSTATETRIVTRGASGSTTLDGSYDHGMARAGINCHF